MFLIISKGRCTDTHDVQWVAETTEGERTRMRRGRKTNKGTDSKTRSNHNNETKKKKGHTERVAMDTRNERIRLNMHETSITTQYMWNMALYNVELSPTFEVATEEVNNVAERPTGASKLG